MKFIERKRWVFLGLPFTFTKYTIEEEMLTINRGLLKTVEDACYMYKVLDVKLETTLFERIAGLGTVICYTGDVTDQVLRLEHIKNSKVIKNFILQVSEEMRKKRRTLNTLNLTEGIAEIDDSDLQ
ncbi:MAG: PH domain-containing protein [Lachnospiraceae bacterium]